MKAHESWLRNSLSSDPLTSNGASRQLYRSSIRTSPSYIHSEKQTARNLNPASEVTTDFFHRQHTDTRGSDCILNTSPDVYTTLVDCDLLNQNSTCTSPHTTVPSLTMADIAVVVPILPACPSHKAPEEEIPVAAYDVSDVVKSDLIVEDESQEDVDDQIDAVTDPVETTKLFESDSASKSFYESDDLGEGWLFVSKTRRRTKKVENSVDKSVKTHQVSRIDQNESTKFRNRLSTDIKRHKNTHRIYKSNRKIVQNPVMTSSIIHSSNWSMKVSQHPITINPLVKVTSQPKTVVASPTIQNSWFSRRIKTVKEDTELQVVRTLMSELEMETAVSETSGNDLQVKQEKPAEDNNSNNINAESKLEPPTPSAPAASIDRQAASTPATSASLLDPVELAACLKKQIEFYFSPQNLHKDSFLNSQMDSEGFVPIVLIAGFRAVQQLTTDIDVVREALKDSASIQFDSTGTRMRSNPSRFSLLLREIPKETPVEQIIELFEKGDCPSCDSCEFAGNSFWYANFLSEADARTAFAYLSGKQFLGAPIKARVKIRSNYISNYSVNQGSVLPPTPRPQEGALPQPQQLPIQPMDYQPPLLYCPPPMQPTPHHPNHAISAGAQYITTRFQPPPPATNQTSPPSSSSANQQQQAIQPMVSPQAFVLQVPYRFDSPAQVPNPYPGPYIPYKLPSNNQQPPAVSNSTTIPSTQYNGSNPTGHRSNYQNRKSAYVQHQQPAVASLPYILTNDPTPPIFSDQLGQFLNSDQQVPISQLVRQYVPNPNDASVVVIQQPQHHLSNIHVNPTNSSGSIQGHNSATASPQHIHRYNRNNQLNYNAPRHQGVHHPQSNNGSGNQPNRNKHMNNRNPHQNLQLHQADISPRLMNKNNPYSNHHHHQHQHQPSYHYAGMHSNGGFGHPPQQQGVYNYQSSLNQEDKRFHPEAAAYSKSNPPLSVARGLSAYSNPLQYNSASGGSLFDNRSNARSNQLNQDKKPHRRLRRKNDEDHRFLQHPLALSTTESQLSSSTRYNPINLNSDNLFPPLPGSDTSPIPINPSSMTTSSSVATDTKLATADVVKGKDSGKQLFETNVVTKPTSEQPEATAAVVTSADATSAVVTSQSADHVATVAAFTSAMTSSSHHQRPVEQSRPPYRRHNLHKNDGQASGELEARERQNDRKRTVLSNNDRPQPQQGGKKTGSGSKYAGRRGSDSGQKNKFEGKSKSRAKIHVESKLLDEVNEEPKMVVPPSQVQPPINPESGDKKPTYADITKSKCRAASEQNSPDSNGATSCCSDSSSEDNKAPDVAVASADDVTNATDAVKPASGHGAILMENPVELVEVEKALQKTAIVSPIATKSQATSSDVASSDKVASMATSSEKQTNKIAPNNSSSEKQNAKSESSASGSSANISNGHNRRDNFDNRRFSNKNNHHDRGYDNDGNHRHGNRGYARSNRGRGGGLRNNPRKSNRSNFNNQLAPADQSTTSTTITGIGR